MTQPQAESLTERVGNNDITYAAAHLVNYQFMGERYGYDSPATESAHSRYIATFAALGSAAEKGAAAELARETEATLPLFISIREAHQATWDALSLVINNLLN